MSHKSMQKKILLITYYWPPAGGPGVQRWLKFVSYLPEYDIHPVVYVPDGAAYPIKDMELIKQIPENIEVIRQPIKEPAQWSKKLFSKKTQQLQSGVLPSKRRSWVTQMLLCIRANFFIPDARVTWVKPSVRYLKQYCTEHTIETIITTGPPHSIHLIGKQLQKEIGVKWLADFRDPWTTIHYFEQMPLSSYSKKKHYQLEKQVLNSADKITVTSRPTKELFRKVTQKPIEVITNGYDEKLLPKNKLQLDVQFTISHIGSLLSDRNPIQLWKAIADLLKRVPNFKNDLKINLAGIISDEVLESIQYFGLIEYIENHGYISHSKAIDLQHTSQVLLLLEMDKQSTRVILPGKLFEYMASKRPILALGPKEGAIAELLQETNAGKYYTYSQYEAITNCLYAYYQKYISEKGLYVNSKGIEAYSRSAVSKKMAKVIWDL